MSNVRITPSIVPATLTQVQSGGRRDAPRGAFELPNQPTEKSKPATSVRPGLATGGMETLIAVQGMAQQAEERRQRRRKAVKRGTDALDLLDELKLSLLAGESMPAVLLKLRGLTAEAQLITGEAGLDNVLADIDLRAQVEIAKREAASRR